MSDVCGISLPAGGAARLDLGGPTLLAIRALFGLDSSTAANLFAGVGADGALVRGHDHGCRCRRSHIACVYVYIVDDEEGGEVDGRV